MADRTYKGVVKEVYEREWSDRDSGEDIILHSFQIESEKRYFRTGTKKPTFKAGDAISFVADGKSGNVDPKSVKGIVPEDVPSPKSEGRGNGGSRSQSARSQGGSRNDYWENKERRDIETTEPRISYSAAQKNATSLVAAALAADALSFGQASKGKRLDMMVDYVEQVTLRLARLQMNAPAILSAEEDE
jgi:hypothetical protein